MNEQPQEIVSQFLAFIFILISVATYFFGKAKPINLDYFELGQIHDNKPLHQPIYKQAKVKKTTKQPKPNTVKTVTKKQKPIVKKAKPTKLQIDCISALQSLGMKKSQAISRTKDVFDKKSPQSIQEFLMEAFKNEYN